MSKDERKKIFEAIFGEKERSKTIENEKVIESLPIVKLTMEAKVLGEEDCVVGDLLNVTIRVDLLNHKPGE